jgi:hypothetical protein
MPKDGGSVFLIVVLRVTHLIKLRLKIKITGNKNIIILNVFYSRRQTPEALKNLESVDNVD